jgi:hypothetical protein
MFETINPLDQQAEGLQAQARQEMQEIKQLEEEQQEQARQEIDQADKHLTPANYPLRKLNLLDALERVTNKITQLDPHNYLQARTEFLQTLKICQKRLEKYEEKTFIPILEKEGKDTLRLGKFEVSFKPSQKIAIDETKLKAALTNPNQFNIFLKKPEFKPMQECKALLLALGIYSDVFTVKEGKKPILNITDTNTIRRRLEEVETDEDEAQGLVSPNAELTREDQVYK